MAPNSFSLPSRVRLAIFGEFRFVDLNSTKAGFQSGTLFAEFLDIRPISCEFSASSSYIFWLHLRDTVCKTLSATGARVPGPGRIDQAHLSFLRLLPRRILEETKLLESTISILILSAKRRLPSG